MLLSTAGSFSPGFRKRFSLGTDIFGVLPHVKIGRVRAIAVSSARHAAVLPEVASAAASLP